MRAFHKCVGTDAFEGGGERYADQLTAPPVGIVAKGVVGKLGHALGQDHVCRALESVELVGLAVYRLRQSYGLLCSNIGDQQILAVFLDKTESICRFKDFIFGNTVQISLASVSVNDHLGAVRHPAVVGAAKGERKRGVVINRFELLAIDERVYVDRLQGGGQNHG